MLPYPSIPTSSAITSNPSSYHGSSNTPYPLYSNQFPTPSSYSTNSANTSTNFPPYTPPYPTQNCPYPQQSAPVRPEYSPYPSVSNTSNSSTGVRYVYKIYLILGII